jgi:hypothetical protein
MRKSKATEALRVAQDIAAIKTALKKHGYRTLKRPKQAAWKITPLNPLPVRGNRGGSRGSGRINGETAEPNQCYLLTYQPAPISTWILHPQNDEPHRQNILNLIQHAIAKQPTNPTGSIS